MMMKNRNKLFLALLIGISLVFLIAAAPTATRYIFGGLVIDGNRDEIQLRVQGWTTQTNVVFTVEQSDGTDVLTITNDGAVSSSAASTGGDTTINGILLVDGQADSVQITAQGYTTQTNPILTVEQSDGTDVLTITNAGALQFAGDLNVSTGTAEFGGDYVSGAQATFTVDFTFPITPTGWYQPLDSADLGAGDGAAATDIAAPTDNTIGKQLILHNINASQVITIDGTGGLTECKADVVLGAGDIMGLLWNGTDWNCQYVRDNS